MPQPTQEDIDYLREHPEVAPHFERQFGVPAAHFITIREKPTENDLEYLKANPDSDTRAAFEKRFGPVGAFLKPKSRLEKIRDEERGMSTLDKMNPTLIQRRMGAVAADIGEQIFSPSNWAATAQGAVDVASRIPEIVSKPENLGEFVRGGIQGLAQVPGGINDLALAGIDFGAQVVGGADPLGAEAYAENPVGSETTRRMLNDWGNDVTRAAGAGDLFDFEEPATEAGKTARRLGEFVVPGGILGGAKAVVPSALGAYGSEVAREVAPESPGWQAAGGIMGATARPVVAATARGIGNAVRRTAGIAKPATQVLTEPGREQIVGGILREAAGDAPTDLTPAPIAGLEPTLGQSTNNPGILQLEKTMAMGDPVTAAPFKTRLQESHGAARDAIEVLRGGGRPDDLRAVADQASEVAQRIADDTLSQATTGRSPAQASEAARARLEGARSITRADRRMAWEAPGFNTEAALVDVDPIRQAMAQEMSSLPKFFDRTFPADIEDALRKLNPREPLSELQALRSELGDKARDAAAKNDSKTAMVYGKLRDAVGNRLDNLEFADPDIQSAYQTARSLSRLEAEKFKKPNEMRSVLGRNRFGGDEVAPADTLRKFVTPGAGGRDKIRQVLAVDDSAEMHSAIADYMAGQMPQGYGPAQTFMRRFSDTLDEMPVVRDRLQAIVDARAAQDALRRSPLNMFVGTDPKVAIERVINHPDRINFVRRLRTQISREFPHAWDGLRAAYVDEIISRIQSAIERTDDGAAAVKPGVINKFYQDHADLTREILGPVGETTLRNVADAAEMMTRTQRGGYPGGSPTYSMFSGDRFIDHLVDKWLMRPEAPWAMAGAGAMKAGPVGFILGGAAGYGGQSLFANAKVQIQTLLRDALLDPRKGRALMMKASPRSMTAIPRAMRPFLKPFLNQAKAAAPGAVQPKRTEQPANGLKIGQVVTGMVNGQKVSYRYKGGDPRDETSWQRSPAQ